MSDFAKVVDDNHPAKSSGKADVSSDTAMTVVGGAAKGVSTALTVVKPFTPIIVAGALLLAGINYVKRSVRSVFSF
jgi:hypothetical protein